MRAQNYVEYALIVATIAILILLTSTLFGAALNGWFQSILVHITGASGGGPMPLLR